MGWADDVFVKTGTDISGWRIFLKESQTNIQYIKFFPYSENHGGGQPYLICIENEEPTEWLTKNKKFENEIRIKLDLRK